MSETLQKPEEFTKFDEIKETREKMRQLLEVIAHGRNFDIEINPTDGGNSQEISLKHKDGRVVNLNSFLPRGYKFQETDQFICHHVKKVVEYPVQKIPYNGFLLSLFHEIGHSHSPQGVTIEDVRRGFLLIAGLPQMLAKSVRTYREYKQRDRGVKDKDAFRELPLEAFMPKWLLAKTSDSQARQERGAWTFALRKLRQLERDGFNVFAGFDNVEMIRADIDFHLVTHEYNFRLNHVLAGHGVPQKSKFVKIYPK